MLLEELETRLTDLEQRTTKATDLLHYTVGGLVGTAVSIMYMCYLIGTVLP